MAFFWTNRSQCMLFHGRVSKYLTFGMTNPNLTGIYMLCIEVYCVIAIFRFKNWMARLIALTLAGTSAYFLFLTNARNALIALVLFYIMAEKHLTQDMITGKMPFRFSAKLQL